MISIRSKLAQKSSGCSQLCRGPIEDGIWQKGTLVPATYLNEAQIQASGLSFSDCRNSASCADPAVQGHGPIQRKHNKMKFMNKTPVIHYVIEMPDSGGSHMAPMATYADTVRVTPSINTVLRNRLTEYAPMCYSMISAGRHNQQ